MRDTFQFFEHALNLAKQFQAEGRFQKATATFQKILSAKYVPPRIAEEAEGRMAELNLQQGRMANARRHLSAALGYQPQHSHYHYLMGVAAEEKDAQRALHHYKKSVNLHPNNPDYLCEYGLLAVECGEIDNGLKSLRRALSLASDDADVLDRVTQGMCKAGCLDEARYVVQSALFRNSRCPKLRQIWQHVQFRILRSNQERKSIKEPVDAGPTMLRFRADVAKTQKPKATWRFDGAASRNGPKMRFRGDEPKPA